jgi:hypothetical protein
MDGNSWWYLSRFSGQANARAHRHQDGSTFDGQWQGGAYTTSTIFSWVVAKPRFMMANARIHAPGDNETSIQVLRMKAALNPVACKPLLGCP